MLPEWTGELWQWVLLVLYGGGAMVFLLLFLAALLSRSGEVD